MCIIMACMKKTPTWDMLHAAEQANNDGAGIAWSEGKKVKWKKGITAKEINTMIETGEAKLPMVIHFRLSTVGGATDNLCHPFPITPTAKTKTEGDGSKVLFHNGHWGDWKKICMETTVKRGTQFPKGQWSDSRAMAWLAGIYGTSFLQLLDEKIAILKNSKKIEIYGSGWKEIDGIHCSNDYFLNPPIYYYQGGEGGYCYRGQSVMGQEEEENDAMYMGFTKADLEKYEEEMDETTEDIDSRMGVDFDENAYKKKLSDDEKQFWGTPDME